MGWTPGVGIIVWTQCALKVNYELYNAGLYSTWEYRRRLPCMNFELYILLCIYMQASSPCRLVTFLLVHSYLHVVHLYSQLQTLICTLIYIYCIVIIIILLYYTYVIIIILFPLYVSVGEQPLTAPCSVAMRKLFRLWSLPPLLAAKTNWTDQCIHLASYIAQLYDELLHCTFSFWV